MLSFLDEDVKNETCMNLYLLHVLLVGMPLLLVAMHLRYLLHVFFRPLAHTTKNAQTLPNESLPVPLDFIAHDGSFPRSPLPYDHAIHVCVPLMLISSGGQSHHELLQTSNE